MFIGMNGTSSSYLSTYPIGYGQQSTPPSILPNPWPTPVPTPNPEPFSPVHVNTIQQVSWIFDAFFGDNDGALSAQEAKWASNYLGFYESNLSNLFNTLSTEIQNGSANVDPNQDGKMTYIAPPIPPGTQTFAAPMSELTQLAQRSGDPNFVEASDLNPSPPPPPPPPPEFTPVELSMTRNISMWIDFSFGNGDMSLDAEEALRASQLLQDYNPNISKMYAKMADGLQNNNPAVDPDQNGKMSYYTPWWTFGNGPDELTMLAQRSGNPYAIEPADFNPSIPMPLMHPNG